MTDRILVGPSKVDITEIIAANRSGRKMPWPERKALIEKHFPCTRPNAINWVKVLSDPHVMGFVLQDILKVDSAPPGRDGPRPTIGEDEGLQRLHELWDDDYSYLPFHEILQALQRSRRLSVRGLAAKVGINYGTVFRLLQGTRAPTVDEIVLVAKAFRRDPAFFLDYRIHVVTAALEHQLRALPELSVKLHQDIVNGAPRAST